MIDPAPTVRLSRLMLREPLASRRARLAAARVRAEILLARLLEERGGAEPPPLNGVPCPSK